MFVPPYRQILEALGVEPEASLDPNGFLVVPNRLLRFLIAALLRRESFDEQQYLAVYDDVRRAVEAAQFESGFHHFIAEGYIEGRLHLCCGVDESWYVQRNPDVRQSIEQGLFPSAQHHFLNNGVHEWRAPNEDAARDIATWRAVLNMDTGAGASPCFATGATDRRAIHAQQTTVAIAETPLVTQQKRATRIKRGPAKAARRHQHN
jgi:hypothetical protein